MADFCWDCAVDRLGMNPSANDFVDVCEEGQVACVLCEGCGQMIWVNHEGKRQPEKGEAS